jgi:hypothetical protein
MAFAGDKVTYYDIGAADMPKLVSEDRCDEDIVLYDARGRPIYSPFYRRRRMGFVQSGQD